MHEEFVNAACSRRYLLVMVFTATFWHIYVGAPQDEGWGAIHAPRTQAISCRYRDLHTGLCKPWMSSFHQITFHMIRKRTHYCEQSLIIQLWQRNGKRDTSLHICYYFVCSRKISSHPHETVRLSPVRSEFAGNRFAIEMHARHVCWEVPGTSIPTTRLGRSLSSVWAIWVNFMFFIFRLLVMLMFRMFAFRSVFFATTWSMRRYDLPKTYSIDPSARYNQKVRYGQPGFCLKFSIRLCLM